MRLVCPSCGAVASMEAWQNDATFRYFAETLSKLPAPVMRSALPYLALFRKGKNALSWKRALTLVRSLKDLTDQGAVHWDVGETRPITAETWGKAMEATIGSRPHGLTNHNYLRHVAWEMAAELAGKVEADRERARQKRNAERDDAPEPISDATRKAIDDLKKKWGE